MSLHWYRFRDAIEIKKLSLMGFVDALGDGERKFGLSSSKDQPIDDKLKSPSAINVCVFVVIINVSEDEGQFLSANLLVIRHKVNINNDNWRGE